MNEVHVSATSALSLALSNLDRLRQELAEWQIEAHKARADKYEIMVESIEWKQRYKDEQRAHAADAKVLRREADQVRQERDKAQADLVWAKAEIRDLQDAAAEMKPATSGNRAFDPEPDPPDMNYALHSAFVEVNLAAQTGPIGQEFLLAAIEWLMDAHNRQVVNLESDRVRWKKAAMDNGSATNELPVSWDEFDQVTTLNNNLESERDKWKLQAGHANDKIAALDMDLSEANGKAEKDEASITSLNSLVYDLAAQRDKLRIRVKDAPEPIWEDRARRLALSIAEAEDLYVNSDNRSDSLRSLAYNTDNEARGWDA